MMFLGPLFLALIIGLFFFCTVIAFAACAASREREAPARSKELLP
jgi:hypothetical protein